MIVLPLFRFTPRLLLAKFYYIFLIGITLGASTGFEASSVDETHFEYDGQYLYAPGEEPVDTTIDWEERASTPPEYVEVLDQYLPNVAEATGREEQMQAVIQTFVEQLLWLSYTIAANSADVVATFVYHNQWWLPQIAVSGALHLAAFVPLLYVVYLLKSGGVTS
ncbi:hypothetical protein [Natranaeroarchaeum sulfidigenes]|uniref:Uncharacterized protein n=1 Tax=Natranaeroarchaeum sulfidigenes TaxID=2784880 RepID=A0A897MQ95_9EURY|nr:hypothetical protein [Natranaeroarchaeum sulfidigenes]QSG02511.1 hypothetical protein AArcS_1294 [Natranaeroarchaeum sulfidigenes]